jgi:zinc and cadmium transporter
MEPVLIYSLISVALVSLVSLIGIVTLSFRTDFLKQCLFVLVSLAVGAFFGNALIHLLPEAFELADNMAYVSLAAILGILSFFVLEKFLHWHHHHAGHNAHEHVGEELFESSETSRVKPHGYLVLTADSVHNLIDGVVITAGYLVSVEVGLATTIAVLLHEIPQEIGDFGVLLQSGMKKLKALALNFATALFAFVGVFIAFVIQNIDGSLPLVMAFAAGNFLYIAGSDLVPELQKSKSFGKSAVQFTAIVAGLVLMFLLLLLE